MPFTEPDIVRLSLIPLITCVFLAANLSACGNKGPLFLPEEEVSNEAPAIPGDEETDAKKDNPEE